jgi:serine/threonine protein kinase
MSKPNWTQIDNFVLSDIIHDSNVGSCYLARNLDSNSDAVVTVLQLKDRETIDTELAAVSSVSHPTIFKPTTIGQTPEGNVYVATSHFGSTLLANATKDDVFEDPVVVLEFIKEIASGLAAAAQKGIIHQNVTPDHIWMRSSDIDQSAYVPLIVDWGVPYLGVNQLKPQYVYSAPEQQENDYADTPALIYALGVLTYELLARGHPSEYGWLVAGTTTLRPMPPNLRELRGNLADATYDFVQTCIRTQAWARYGTFPEYFAALDVAIAAESTRSGRAFLPVSRNDGDSRRGRVVLGAVALLAVIAVILWFMFAWLPGQDRSAVAQSTTPSVTATVVQLNTLDNVSVSAETLTPDDPIAITWQWNEPIDEAEFNVYLIGEETTRLPGAVNLADDGNYTFEGVLPEMMAGNYTMQVRLETLSDGSLLIESGLVPIMITGLPTEVLPTPSDAPDPNVTVAAVAATATEDQTPTVMPTATTTPTLEPTPTPEPTEPLVPSVRVVTLAANIRGGPGLPFDIIGGLRQGAVVEVIGADEGGFWYLIRLVDGRTGWVAASVVEPAWDGATSNLPVADNIPTLPTRTPTFIPPTLPPVPTPQVTEPVQSPPTPTTAPPTPIPVPPTPTPISPT